MIKRVRLLIQDLKETLFMHSRTVRRMQEAAWEEGWDHGRTIHYESHAAHWNPYRHNN